MSRFSDFTPKLFTILKEGYSKSDFRADALAGLTVAVVALPLAMALAIASGATPDKGLITAVIAGFLTSVLGGSLVQIGGPTGAFVVVIFGVIAHHGYDGLILATILAGIILIVSGYAKLGQLIKFIPHPVITGFTAGIAVIIASSQVKDFLGLKMNSVPADFFPKWGGYFENIGTVDPSTLGVGLSALAIIILLRLYAPKFPSHLIALVIASAVAIVLKLPVDTIGSRFPDLPSGFPVPELPTFSYAKIREVIPSAFTIAFLAGIEALLCATVADGMTGRKHRSNQELVAQGVANLASAACGGLPATGAIARTATNVKAGAKTPMAGIFHAVLVLFFMLFASDVMAYIPMAALAAILFVVAWGMSEIGHFVHIFKISPSDRNVMVLTFLLTVMVDLTVAIGVGVTLASLLFMRHMTRSVNISSERRRATDAQEDGFEEDEQRADLPAGVEAFRVAGPLFFGVAGDLLETLKAIGQMPKILILRIRLVPYLDATGATAIGNIVKRCQAAGTIVILSGTQPQPEEMLRKANIVDGKDGVIYSPAYKTSVQIAEKLAKGESV